MIRSFLQKVLRGTSFRRKLPQRFGRRSLYVSPDSQLKYLKWSEAAFDLDLLKLVDEFVTEESCVWDIGANIGVLTVAAAHRATRGSVLAVEADIWLAQLLRKTRNLQSNHDLSIEVLPVAVSHENGVAVFSIANAGRAANSLEVVGSRTISQGSREKVFVPTMTLDSLLGTFGRPTFVKIDVEGAEALALRGASEILKSVRPIFYIEVGAENSQQVFQIFQDYHYDLYDGDVQKELRTPLTTCAFNLIAIPRLISGGSPS